MKPRSIYRCLAVGLLLGLPGPAGYVLGDVTLPRILGSGMVLQRDLPVPVWGWAGAGEKVVVSFAGQSRSVKAGEDGRWMLRLDPLKARAC